MHKVLPQSRIHRVGILFGLQDVLIDPDELFFAAGVLTEDVIGNSVKPCRKASLSAKASNVFVSLEESLLRKVVGQCEIRSCKLPQEAPNA